MLTKNYEIAIIILVKLQFVKKELFQNLVPSPQLFYRQTVSSRILKYNTKVLLINTNFLRNFK